MPSVLEEKRAQNAEVERLCRMIDQCKRLGNSLRQAYDERRALGGGSRARLGNLLACAEDAADFIQKECHRMQIDYPNTPLVQDGLRTCARCGNRSSAMHVFKDRGPLCGWCYDLHVKHGDAVAMPDPTEAAPAAGAPC